MRNLLIISLLLLLSPAKLYPQSTRGEAARFQKGWKDLKVVITGKILNFDPQNGQRTITFEIPDLLERMSSYAAVVDSTGMFKTEAICAYPQQINVIYGNHTSLFCAPGDSLYIEMDTGGYSVQLKHGRFAEMGNNIALFLREKPVAAYSTGHRIEAIKNKSPKEYRIYIEEREKVYRAYLEKFIEVFDPDSLFLEWADDHLKFESWTSLLHYRWTHFQDTESQSTIPSDYFSFLGQYQMDNQTLLSADHVEFLSEYFQYTLANPADSAQKAEALFEKKLITEGARILKRQIQLNTKGFTRELFLTKLYADALKGLQLNEFERLYRPGELENTYLRDLIAKKHRQLKAYLSNQVTDGTNLSTIGNEIVASLIDTIVSRYSGKVIYVDFWAPWCSPCMAEMPHSKKLQEEFREENVVFLFLASQCSEDSWKATISNRELTGEHILLTDDQYRILAAEFDISGIPRYLMIDRGGNVVLEDAPRPGSAKTAGVIKALLN